jgi:hypothetical protein
VSEEWIMVNGEWLMVERRRGNPSSMFQVVESWKSVSVTRVASSFRAPSKRETRRL